MEEEAPPRGAGPDRAVRPEEDDDEDKDADEHEHAERPQRDVAHDALLIPLNRSNGTLWRVEVGAVDGVVGEDEEDHLGFRF